MANTTVPTLLPVYRWAQLVGLHPLHFMAVDVDFSGVSDDRVPYCNDPILQYSWQGGGAIGRDDVAIAIANAEQMLATLLGYQLLPRWEVAEPVRLNRPSNPNLFSKSWGDIRGLWQTVQTNYGQLLYGGQELRELIIADSPITYGHSPSNSGIYFETATVTVVTTVPAEEIAVFYPNLGPAENYGDEWRIRPIKVVDNGPNVTITFRRELAVLPDLIESFTPRAVVGTVDANFLTTVDVYRIRNDPSQQIEFIWRSEQSTCDCGSSNCVACESSIQDGCLQIASPRIGLFSGRPAEWNAGTQVFDSTEWTVYRAPDRARVWYRAGLRNLRSSNPLHEMDSIWERAVAYLSLSYLDRELCACESITQHMKHWQEDLLMSASGPSSSVAYGNIDIMNNPIGTTRAALYAWGLVKKYKLGEGVSA